MTKSSFMRWGYLFLLYIFCVVLILSSSVQAVGISIPHDRSYDFKPGLEFTIKFRAIFATRDTLISISGDFAKYATLSRKSILLADPDKSVSIHVKIPNNVQAEDFKPGTNKIMIKIEDNLSEVKSTGMFILSSSAATSINILIPYPGFYMEIPEFSVTNINKGENAKLIFTGWNRGSNDLVNTYYDLNIKDKDSKVLLNKSENNLAIFTGEKKNFNVPLSTYSFTSGYYNATLNYYYLDKIITENMMFKIGELNVDIVNNTQLLFNDSIQQFDIKVRSDWNDVIKGVYGVVNFNGEESKTSPVDLSNFETKVLTTYIDPSEIAVGNYTLGITLFYSDEQKEKSVNLELVERPPQEIEKKPVNLVLVILIVLIVLLLMGMVLFIIFYMKRQKSQGKGNGKKE